MDKELRRYLKWKRALRKIQITPNDLVDILEAAHGKDISTDLIRARIRLNEAKSEKRDEQIIRKLGNISLWFSVAALIFNVLVVVKRLGLL